MSSDLTEISFPVYESLSQFHFKLVHKKLCFRKLNLEMHFFTHLFIVVMRESDKLRILWRITTNALFTSFEHQAVLSS